MNVEKSRLVILKITFGPTDKPTACFLKAPCLPLGHPLMLPACLSPSFPQTASRIRDLNPMSLISFQCPPQPTTETAPLLKVMGKLPEASSKGFSQFLYWTPSQRQIVLLYRNICCPFYWTSPCGRRIFLIPVVAA